MKDILYCANFSIIESRPICIYQIEANLYLLNRGQLFDWNDANLLIESRPICINWIEANLYLLNWGQSLFIESRLICFIWIKANLFIQLRPICLLNWGQSVFIKANLYQIKTDSYLIRSQIQGQSVLHLYYNFWFTVPDDIKTDAKFSSHNNYMHDYDIATVYFSVFFHKLKLCCC